MTLDMFLGTINFITVKVAKNFCDAPKRMNNGNNIATTYNISATMELNFHINFTVLLNYTVF
jgi:hypothetical protein